MKTNLLVLTILTITLLYNINCDNSEYRIINLGNITTENAYIPVISGQKFILELEGNPTTGYSWFLENHEALMASKLITPENLTENNSGEFYRKPKDSTENEVRRVGVGGIFHFKFSTNADLEGQEDITLVYKRPWEQDISIKKTISLKVVKDKDL